MDKANEHYHILCGYKEPAIISCRADNFESWLRVALKEGLPIAQNFGDWIADPESVLVLKGDPVKANELEDLINTAEILVVSYISEK